MKKSCSGKESKVVTTKDAESASNDSKNSQEHLTEEQLYINKQLSESGIDSEGLGWLEKRNIVKTINVSLNSSASEKLQRISPRLANSSNLRAKWVENSFENSKEDSNNEKSSKNRLGKRESKLTVTSTRKLNALCENQCNNEKATQDLEDTTLKSVNRNEILENVKITNETPKSSRKVHYIKVHVEENSKEECTEIVSSEGDSPGLHLRKKRAPHSEVDATDGPKKLKMEETSNGISPEEESPLRVEVELEKRKRNAPFIVRDIKLIVADCEIRNKKWKETFSKYKWPTRWGNPSVRNCNEKWDGKHIPQKLLHRYQKYLSSNNLFHPIFFPVNSQDGTDFNNLSGEISSQTNRHSECGDEMENSFIDLSQGSLINEESKRKDAENNLNASTSAGENSGRMVLRNRSQQKPIILDEDDYSSDESGDWFSSQKPNKKQKINLKIKKGGDQNNKQLVSKMEKCNINKRDGNDMGRRNGSRSDAGLTVGSLMSNNAISNSKLGPDPDTMVCPICSIRFKKQHIESHANECASKTYRD